MVKVASTFEMKFNSTLWKRKT